MKKRENKNRKKWDLRTRHNELYDQKNKRRKLTNKYYQEKREEGLLESTSNYHLRKKREHPRPYRHRSNGSKTIVELKNLNSKYIKNVLRNNMELDVLFRFVESAIKDFPEYVYMMMPDRNRRRVRNSITFPQAMRLFFGKSEMITQHFDKRPSYGLDSMLRTTGMRPYDIRVQPFTNTIESIVSYIEKAVKPLLLGTKYENCDFDFNFLEIKLYMGKQLVGENCNKSVGAHTDCIFDDKGKQSVNDSARGEHLTTILTFGYPRQLFFVRCSKDMNKEQVKWNEDKDPNDYVTLEHNSLFVLFPDDEKPTSTEPEKHMLRKTKHGVKFKGNLPFSIALVFRSVKKLSLFHSTDTKVPDGTFHRDSLANTFKKNSWCWTPPKGITGIEENVQARNFLENKRYRSAFNIADKKFQQTEVLICTNKLLNEIRKFVNKYNG